MQTTQPKAGERTQDHFQKCCHCGEMVNLDLEGAQYPNGEAAHEECHDARQFELANGGDFRD